MQQRWYGDRFCSSFRLLVQEERQSCLPLHMELHEQVNALSDGAGFDIRQATCQSLGDLLPCLRPILEGAGVRRQLPQDFLIVAQGEAMAQVLTTTRRRRRGGRRGSQDYNIRLGRFNRRRHGKTNERTRRRENVSDSNLKQLFWTEK